MPKILLISDKKNWSYAAIAEGVIKFNDNSDIKFRHISCKGNVDKIKSLKKKYDFYFVIGWQNTRSLPFLNPRKTIVGVHSHQSFDSKRTTPNRDILPSKSNVAYLSKFLAVNTVSLRLHNIMTLSGIRHSYTPNGVDTDIFRSQERPKKYVACCVAAEKNYWNKGVTDFIIPACKKAGFSFITLGKNKIINKNMSLFYNKSNVYICASLSEGMPMSILEAGACGCAIVSTRCGDIIHLINNGVNGFLVDRNIREIRVSLEKLKDMNCFCRMSKTIRDDIVRDWSWKVNAPKWIRFLEHYVK